MCTAVSPSTGNIGLPFSGHSADVSFLRTVLLRINAMRFAPLATVALVIWVSPPLLAQTPDANGNMPVPVAQAPESAPPAVQAPEPEPPVAPAPRSAPPVIAAPETIPSPPPAAENAPPVIVKPWQATPLPSARFSFSRVETGVLRLDTQTGQITLCRAHTVGWACEAVPEDRAALEKEIARLQDEVTDLKRQLSALQPPPPPRPPAPVPDSSDKKPPLLTDEDIARARAYVEEAWRRLVEMLMSFQKDVMRKT
jgi:hypothetical protein